MIFKIDERVKMIVGKVKFGRNTLSDTMYFRTAPTNEIESTYFSCIVVPYC